MSSPPRNEYWLVCPVCHKANPADRRNCLYCWGAALGGQTPVSDAELPEVLRLIQLRQRRRRNTIRLAASAAVAVLLVAVIVPMLFNYTDVLAPVPKTANSNSAPGDWSMFRHDPGNTGATGNNVALPTGTLKWAFAAGDVIHSSAAVANGTVYFGSRDGKLYAVDAETGTQRWAFQTGSRVESSPAVAGGRVFVGSNDGFMYALDAGTGKQLWKFRTVYPILSSPAVANGMVFFGSDDYSVYAVDAVRGTKVWQFNARGPVESSPTVVNGLVYIATGTEYVFVLNANTGRPRLRFKMFDSTYGAVAVSGSNGMVSSFGGDFYVFNGAARNWPLEYELKPYWVQVWAFGLAPLPPAQSGFEWALKIGRAVSSSPVVQGDALYVGADKTLTAIDLTTHKKLWTFPTDGAVRATPAVAGGTAFVASEDGRLYAVRTADGQKVWDYKTGDRISASPTLADGVIYVGSHDGHLYAIK
jgi:outer membrane protein assembly factor BamB